MLAVADTFSDSPPDAATTPRHRRMSSAAPDAAFAADGAYRYAGTRRHVDIDLLPRRGDARAAYAFSWRRRHVIRGFYVRRYAMSMPSMLALRAEQPLCCATRHALK